MLLVHWHCTDDNTNRKAGASFCARVASLLLASHKLLVSRWLH